MNKGQRISYILIMFVAVLFIIGSLFIAESRTDYTIIGLIMLFGAYVFETNCIIKNKLE